MTHDIEKPDFLVIYRNSKKKLNIVLNVLETHASHLAGLGLGSSNKIYKCITELEEVLESFEEAHNLMFNELLNSQSETSNLMLKTIFAVSENKVKLNADQNSDAGV